MKLGKAGQVALAVGATVWIGIAAALVFALPAGSSSPDVQAVTDPTYGRILATGGGLALYTFASDHDGVSTCTGGCLSAWPPLTVPAGTTPTAGPGVPTASLGTAVQGDGRTQVTWNSLPLYTFSCDTPGNATGQGQGGFSLVQLPATTPTTTTPPATTMPTSVSSTTVPTSTTVPANNIGGSGTNGSGSTPSASASSTRSSSGSSSPATAPAGSVAPTALAFTGPSNAVRDSAFVGLALMVTGATGLLALRRRRLRAA